MIAPTAPAPSAHRWLLLTLIASSAASAALAAVRLTYSGSPAYLFLGWNLFLAWVPMLIAAVLCEHADVLCQRKHMAHLVWVAALWLLFFPNAPYLVTDFKHLRERPGAPLWYDVLLVASFAWNGLLLGFASLYLVQELIRRHLGHAAASAAFATAVTLGGFGVYLGRFARLNSWDVLFRPAKVVSHVAHSLTDSRAILISGLYCLVIGVAYLGLLGLIRVHARTVARTRG